MSRRTRVFLGIVTLLFTAELSFAASGVSITRPAPPSPQIEGLEIHPQFLLEPRETGDPKNPGLQVRMHVRLKRPFWNLLHRLTPVQAKPSGWYELIVPLDGPVEPIPLTAVGPTGQIERETGTANFPDFPKWKERVLNPGTRLRWTVGAGVTSLTFNQTGFSQLTQLNVTPKFAVDYDLVPQKWDIGGSAFGTALTLGTNQAGVAFHAIGANLRLGYRVPLPQSAWSLSVKAGIYFNTTFATDATGGEFSYQNVAGPQLFPVLSRSLGTDGSAYLYGKFSPVAVGLSFLTIDNNEIAVGIGYTVGSRDREFRMRRWGVTVDLSRINLAYSGGVIRCDTATLGAQLSL